MCSKAVSTKNKGALENAASPPLSSGSSEKCQKEKFPSSTTSTSTTFSTDFYSASLPRGLWGWPSLCSASSGWDVRNNIDVKKQHPPKFRSLLTWYHDTSKISFKWSEMGAFSGVLPTFVLLRTIKDGHTTNWQILGKSHYFLLMASQHSQLQTFTRTDIFPSFQFPRIWDELLLLVQHLAKVHTLGKTNIEPVAEISPILHGTSVGKFTGESMKWPLRGFYVC